jgi:pimeloyl-ACP methyl ester carboxylesterase
MTDIEPTTTPDFGMPRVRPRDVVAPVTRFLRAGLPAAKTNRKERWADTGGDAPKLNAIGLSSAGLDSFAVTAVRAVSGGAVKREMPQVLTEMREALDVFQDAGWLDDPLSYHRTPNAPRVHVQSFHALEMTWQRMVFDSGYEPHKGEPGANRWMDYSANRQATVRMLRHPEPAPWLVLLHGSYMGYLRTDAPVFDPVRLHTELGYNVLMPVLPLHGRRRVKDGLVPRALPSLNAMDNVHGLAQAGWDIRRLIAWIRREDDLPITLYGISLGGYVSALTSALLQDKPVDRVLAGIPAVDFPSIFTSQMPPRAKETAWYPEFAANIATVHRPISVLGLPAPTVPTDHLRIYAARHDRVLKPLHQAAKLWQHWNRPEILWFDGGHVASSRNKQVAAFVNDTLTLT